MSHNINPKDQTVENCLKREIIILILVQDNYNAIIKH